MVVDFIKTAYTADMRLWQGSDRTVKVRWFRAAPDAKMAPGPTLFVSSRHDDTKASGPEPKLGEVKGTLEYDKGRNDLGYAGQKFCGSVLAWRTGGLVGRDPVITTAPDGWCDCCGKRPIALPGGLGFGGPQEDPRPWSGGKGLGGAFVVTRKKLVTFYGGKGLGGAFDASYRQGLTFYGGKGLGGTFSVQAGEAVSFTGGIGLGGAFVVGRQQGLAFAGGIGLGGAFVVGRQQGLAFAGGIGLGGAFAVRPGVRYPFAGGKGLGGAFDASYRQGLTFAGGKGLGGAFGVRRLPETDMQTVWADEVINYNGNLATQFQDVNQRYNSYGLQNPPANGDWQEWGFYLPAGTYTLLILGITGPDYGKTDCNIDGVSQFTGTDWYSAGTTYNVVKGGTVTVASDGYHVLRLTVNGHNGSSGSYFFGPTKIWFRL